MSSGAVSHYESKEQQRLLNEVESAESADRAALEALDSAETANFDGTIVVAELTAITRLAGAAIQEINVAHRRRNQHGSASDLTPKKVREARDRYRRLLQAQNGAQYVSLLARSHETARELVVAEMRLRDYEYTHAVSIWHSSERLSPREKIPPPFWKTLAEACRAFVDSVESKGTETYRHFARDWKRVLDIDAMSPSAVVSFLSTHTSASHKIHRECLVFALSKSGQELIDHLRDIQAIAKSRPLDDVHLGPSDYLNLRFPPNLLDPNPKNDTALRSAIETVARSYGILLGLGKDHNPAPVSHSLGVRSKMSKRQRELYGFL